MAAALVRLRSGGRIDVRSAGSDPADTINPAVIEAMAELGVDMSEEFPKPLTDEVVRAADVVITMGCGDACPIYPGKRYEDWALDDPAGQDLDTVRLIRDDLDGRIRVLVGELVPDDAVTGPLTSPSGVALGRPDGSGRWEVQRWHELGTVPLEHPGAALSQSRPSPGASRRLRDGYRPRTNRANRRAVSGDLPAERPAPAPSGHRRRGVDSRRVGPPTRGSGRGSRPFA